MAVSDAGLTACTARRPVHITDDSSWRHADSTWFVRTFLCVRTLMELFSDWLEWLSELSRLQSNIVMTLSVSSVVFRPWLEQSRSSTEVINTSSFQWLVPQFLATVAYQTVKCCLWVQYCDDCLRSSDYYLRACDYYLHTCDYYVRACDYHVRACDQLLPVCLWLLPVCQWLLRACLWLLPVSLWLLPACLWYIINAEFNYKFCSRF